MRPVVSADDIRRGIENSGGDPGAKPYRQRRRDHEPSRAELDLAAAILLGLERLGLSKTRLATQVGMSRANLSSRLTGRQFLSRAVAEACAKALGVDLPDAYPVPGLPGQALAQGLRTPMNMPRFLAPALGENPSINARVRRAIDAGRLAKGWTVEQLAEVAGYHYRKVGRLLRGTCPTPMNFGEAEDLCTAVGLNLEVVTSKRESERPAV